METIINLLKDKNYHLEKFHDLNAAELLNFAEGDFDNLEVFYQSRETILDLIRCIDRLIDAASAAEGAAGPGASTPITVSDAEKREITSCMHMKSELVTRILGQDLQILSMIEQAKSNIIKELRQVQGAKKAVGAYKSGPPANKLDEKA
jgi:hypothetical protein